MALGIQIGPVVPGLEGVFDVGQAGVGEFGIVTQEHGFQVGPVDPAQAFRRCRRPRCSVGEKAVSLQSAARAHDEDLKHRLAESETVGPVAFGQRADQQVEVFDVVPYTRLQLLPEMSCSR